MKKRDEITFILLLFLTWIALWQPFYTMNPVVYSIAISLSGIALVGIVRCGIIDRPIVNSNHDRFFWKGKMILGGIAIVSIYWISLTSSREFMIQRGGGIWAFFFLLSGVIGVLESKDTSPVSSAVLTLLYGILLTSSSKVSTFFLIENLGQLLFAFVFLLMANIDLRLETMAVLKKRGKNNFLPTLGNTNASYDVLFRDFWEKNRGMVIAVSLHYPSPLIILLAEEPAHIEYTLSDGRKILKYDPCKLVKINFLKHLSKTKLTSDQKQYLVTYVKTILENDSNYVSCERFRYKRFCGYRRKEQD